MLRLKPRRPAEDRRNAAAPASCAIGGGETPCPTCGFSSAEIRCPRCFSLKVKGCGGSCSSCGVG